MALEGIRSVKTKGVEGNYEHVRVVFGPHYFFELRREQDGKVTMVLGATHHGFKADASEVGGELENFINEIRHSHSKNSVD